MSACLFTWRLKTFEETSEEELEKAMALWKATLEEFKKSPEQQDNRFYMDRYCGFQDNLERGTFYLAGIKRGKAK